MTALTRNPQNTNLKQSTKFRLNFDRLPGITYFCQSANLPGISASEVPRATPFVDVYVPGEKLVYDTFNVTFIVDEDMRAWTEVHDWLRGITFPNNFEEYINLGRAGNPAYTASSFTNKPQPQYSSAVLTLYSNKNNPNMRIKFIGIFPISLSTIIFNTQDTAENIVTADATFRFSYYNYERISV